MISDINLVVSLSRTNAQASLEHRPLGNQACRQSSSTLPMLARRATPIHAGLGIFSLPNLHRAALPNDDRKIPQLTTAVGQARGLMAPWPLCLQARRKVDGTSPHASPDPCPAGRYFPVSATLSALSIIFNKFSSQPSLSELVWCRYALWHMELADLCPRGPQRRTRGL